MASELKTRWSDRFRRYMPRARRRANSDPSPSPSPTSDNPAPPETTSTHLAPTPPIELALVGEVTRHAVQVEGARIVKKEYNSAMGTLKIVLGTLHSSLNRLPPLQLAVGGLLECIENLRIDEQNRRAYDELARDLAELVTLLQKHVVEANPQNVPYSIANVARAISEQTKMVQECQSRSNASRLVLAIENDEAILNCYRRIEALFRQLQADISLSIWDILMEQRMDANLDRLSPVHDAYYNAALTSTTTATNRVGCTKNTRVNLLNDAHDWSRREDAPKIYWMNGMAGTGKTTIAYTMCENLRENDQLGASFFCSRNSQDCRDIARIVPTIAYQLGRYSNPYRKALHDVLRDEPDAAKRNVNTQFDFLISKPLAVMGKAMPKDVVVVIDALDECADVCGVKNILEILLKRADNLPIKFFVASRPEPAISGRMMAHDGALRSVLHLHNIEKSLVQEDIRTYLVEALESAQVSASDINELAARAGSLFIFAATAVRYIMPMNSIVDPQERLQIILGIHVPGGDKRYNELDNLYRTILSKALRNDELESKEIERQQRVLWTVVCAKEPLSPSTLSDLLDIGTEQHVWMAIQPLQSVLHISESTGVVSALHASFPDFLLDPDRSNAFHCDPNGHNTYLTTRCLGVMDQLLKFNICGLDSSYQLDREVPYLESRVEVSISPALFYACQHWSDHLVGTTSLAELVSPLDRFLKSQLLFWMEVLSLKKRSSRGETILSQAVNLLSTDPDLTELRDIADDARNFATTFAANPCSFSTPHIYISVLPFTSRGSHIWKHYWPRMQGLLRIEGAATEGRARSSLATWETGQPVLSAALSSNSKRVATALGWFKSEGKITIWDTSSGIPILELSDDHSGDITSVTFSPNDSCVASGSCDNAVRIWDASKGKLIAGPLQGHIAEITSVAFSADGTRLASGSLDSTVRIWDAYSGAQLGKPLKGHQGAVWSVAFSPNGKQLASSSDDCTIRVWPPEAGTTATVIEGHARGIRSIAYSHDGLRLASGSADRTVRIWDASNGTLLAGPFEGHTNDVLCVSFSPDDIRVISSSVDQTIRVWETVSGRLLGGPFRDHSHQIRSVLFTSDGTRILSCSDDCTIRIWDARQGSIGIAKSLGHTGGINSVAVSLDGTRVASGSDDSTICIWDMHNGALVAGPFKGHTSLVSSVSFSLDGARVVSGSWDQTARVWDAFTGTLLTGPIKGHSDTVTSVAFSPDGCQIASGSFDKTVRLWSSQTGAPVAMPFEGHTDHVTSITFSPNGSRIVSGSLDSTVLMWDANSGTELWASNAHARWVNCVTFSPDGTRVVSGSNDDTILVLDARDGAVLRGPFTHPSAVSSVALSPDGTRLVSSSIDKALRVWDVESGTIVVGPLNGHTSWIGSAMFSSDGTHIVSGSSDHTIRIWDIAATTRAGATSSDYWPTDQDGWLTDSLSQRLFWVPSDLRHGFGFLTPSRPIVVNASCTTRIDETTLLGERWHRCFNASPVLVSS